MQNRAQYLNIFVLKKVLNFFLLVPLVVWFTITAQIMKFSIKDFLSKCYQIRSFLWIWSHLLKKSLMENFIFCAAYGPANWSARRQIPRANYFVIIIYYEVICIIFWMKIFQNIVFFAFWRRKIRTHLAKGALLQVVLCKV